MPCTSYMMHPMTHVPSILPPRQTSFWTRAHRHLGTAKDPWNPLKVVQAPWHAQTAQTARAYMYTTASIAHRCIHDATHCSMHVHPLRNDRDPPESPQDVARRATVPVRARILGHLSIERMTLYLACTLWSG
jgi:hypothetical protein